MWMEQGRWGFKELTSGNEAQHRKLKEPQQAVIEAIESGRLSTRPKADNFAGDYRYTGTTPDGDEFKHKDTGRGLSPRANVTKEGNS